ncbi:F-actin-monooxygenase Mical isoform X2 [Bombyx mandarina]|uniref:F-actin monooxygenase n=1 Tax=Bombyx mandarina TaxID=7092 RepID=A0A6J2K167_BOMMA|nr:F-actin-monooxygenase Mical isoform X2 [Bombyx mandarina]
MNTGPTPPECALAAEMFDHFCSAGTMKQILGLHREICATLNLIPTRLPDFYPKLKAKLASSWKAQALFKKFDARANHKVYSKGRSCTTTKVLIIGAGPCGLRAAIECQLLGAKVVVVEKRDRMSRNNVLHLWPFVIDDLRALGAKKFFGKFCAGSIDHISIRQLQCILMKVALLLGVEIHEGVGFEELLEPSISENSEILGWRARVSPIDNVVSQYEFDVLLGADGKRNTLQGFKRKEFRGKLAMAITANFINRHTEQEASVPEISGVAFIFNQKFFKELYEETGIDLENIVYYKDDTHYFVMTAKKHSLLDKGVLLKDYAEVSRLLSVENVDRAALMRYAQDAARFSTDGRLPLRDFALNHYGEPDVALFDFTSMYAAENASMVYERLGRRLLCQLVGDSLLEPFWPTGSGCARGFLSALDAAWAVRAWGQTPTPHPLEVIAERESIYRLLAQTIPENLHRDFGAYTLDPGTRYPNLNRRAVTPIRVTSFYDSDDPLPLDAAPSSIRKRRRESDVSDDVLSAWVGWSEPGIRAAVGPNALSALLRRYRPDLLPATSTPRSVYHVLHHEFGIVPFSSGGTMRDVSDAKVRSYLARVYNAFKGEVPHVHHETDVFDQIKLSQQKEKHIRNTAEHSLSMYANAGDADKSHSSCRKKRRSLRSSQVSNDPAEYIRKKIGKLDLDDITQLARLIEGHDAATDSDLRIDKQRDLQEQILALLDPEESPDPKVLRESLAHLLQGASRTQVHRDQSEIAQFFQENFEKPVKPPRRLKGLAANSVKIPDLTEFEDSADTDVTVVKVDMKTPRAASVDREKLTRSSESPFRAPRNRRLSDVLEKSKDSESAVVFKRSNSIDSGEVANTRRIAEMFEGQRRRDTPSPDKRSTRSASTNPEMALRLQRMADIIEGKKRDTPSPDRVKHESIGNPEMELRRQRVVDLIKGPKPLALEPTQRKNNAEMSFRMQRMSDIMQKKNAEAKRPKTMSRRKAAREIMKQRFEKSVQMLAAEPRLDFAPSADLENDYGLQQYRASAPDFEERVKKLERKLQHYEEGRIVGGGARTSGGGDRVARLAAELSGGPTCSLTPRPSKPKDLMRSVGKIERDDWNMKEIERKILENRLGRPEPKTAEKVPKWDREQFLGRQRRLKEGDGSEKWVEIDDTLNKLNQKLNDSGRPDHGTKKVANLATKFVKKDETEQDKGRPKEVKRGWRGPASTGMQCAACGTRVFAAEGVTADGLHLHRACFRCAVCKTVLRPGNYKMERYGNRLVCLRHSGVSVTDAVAAASALDAPQPTRSQAPTPTPERISIELSDSGAREIDEDEWTDRNFLASETSGAGGLSDEEESSSEDYTDADEGDNEADHSPEPQGIAEVRSPRTDLYFSGDSFGYDDYSDDGAESSGNESCSRMRAAREARRREVPADNRLPTDSSEVESEEESEEESSDEEVSSATEVSTDSEFAREETAPVPSLPAILVTEATPPAPPPPQDYPLSRTRSAGGLATKRALELKRKYLLGEPSPPAVRKSDSTSQIDNKFEAFRSTITEFQKLLHPAPVSSIAQPQKPIVSFQTADGDIKPQPMPDIIKNLCNDAPVDLLTKIDSPLCKDWSSDTLHEGNKGRLDLESDSLSEDSSHTATAPNQAVPRVEVHDEGGELIQLDSLMLVNSCTEDNDEKVSAAATVTGPTVVAAESESSESCRDATTLALTETELSDWAAESGVLDDCGFDEKDDRKRSKNPRTLSGPKLVHEAKNISAVASHVCGKTSPTEPVVYSNALEHFEFADEGEQDPSLESPLTPKNYGYMELVDDDYAYSPSNDRSMNFIEKTFSETVLKPASQEVSVRQEEPITETSAEIEAVSEPQGELKSPPHCLKYTDTDPSDRSTSEKQTSDSITNVSSTPELKIGRLSLSEVSSPIDKVDKTESLEEASPPLISESTMSSIIPNSIPFSGSCSIRLYSPAICRSASETFHRSNSRNLESPRSGDVSMSINLSSASSISPMSPVLAQDTTDKVQEIKREREEQTELVRRLVLERLGSGPRANRKCNRRIRASPTCSMSPPVPPPPVLPEPPPPPPPPRPSPPLMPIQVTPSFSDPELARERRSKGIMKSISSYLNRRLGPRHKEPQQRITNAHKSTGALQQEAPPVPPRPAGYMPPTPPHEQQSPPRVPPGPACDVDERDAMQLWFEARWARLVAQRRAREEPRGESTARRLARLERRLTRPLSAEQQAATVAELVQVSAQRDAHQALMAADRRRTAARSSVGD